MRKFIFVSFILSIIISCNKKNKNSNDSGSSAASSAASTTANVAANGFFLTAPIDTHSKICEEGWKQVDGNCVYGGTISIKIKGGFRRFIDTTYPGYSGLRYSLQSTSSSNNRVPVQTTMSQLPTQTLINLGPSENRTVFCKKFGPLWTYENNACSYSVTLNSDDISEQMKQSLCITDGTGGCNLSALLDQENQQKEINVTSAVANTGTVTVANTDVSTGGVSDSIHRESIDANDLLSLSVGPFKSCSFLPSYWKNSTEGNSSGGTMCSVSVRLVDMNFYTKLSQFFCESQGDLWVWSGQACNMPPEVSNKWLEDFKNKFGLIPAPSK